MRRREGRAVRLPVANFPSIVMCGCGMLNRPRGQSRYQRCIYPPLLAVIRQPSRRCVSAFQPGASLVGSFARHDE